jgi:hypothetical protein
VSVWEGTRLWRKLNDKVYNLCASRDSVRVSKPRKMRWETHVVSTVTIRHAYNILIGEREEWRSKRHYYFPKTTTDSSHLSDFKAVSVKGKVVPVFN